MTTTDSRGLLATHDHGSRQPGAGPALAPAPERQESAFAAVRRICGGRVHGVRLYRLWGVAFNLPPAAIRVPVQRRPGTQERVDLAFLWPSLEPPDPNAKPPAPGPAAETSQAFARVFMTIAS